MSSLGKGDKGHSGRAPEVQGSVGRGSHLSSLVRKRGCPQLGQGRGGLNAVKARPYFIPPVEGKGSACWCKGHPH